MIIWRGDIDLVSSLSTNWRHFFYGVTVGGWGFGFIVRKKIQDSQSV